MLERRQLFESGEKDPVRILPLSSKCERPFMVRQRRLEKQQSNGTAAL